MFTADIGVKIFSGISQVCKPFSKFMEVPELGILMILFVFTAAIAISSIVTGDK